MAAAKAALHTIAVMMTSPPLSQHKRQNSNMLESWQWQETSHSKREADEEATALGAANSVALGAGAVTSKSNDAGAMGPAQWARQIELHNDDRGLPGTQPASGQSAGFSGDGPKYS
jgi:hypothetical protein